MRTEIVLSLATLLIALVPPQATAQSGWNVDLVGGVPGTVEDTAVSGGFIYCASRSGLLILDPTMKPAMRQVAFLPLTGRGRGVDVAGGIACVAADEAGLHVIDVSDPARPRLLGTSVVPTHAFDALMDGGIVFVSDSYGGMRVFDISDPAVPTLIGYRPLGGSLGEIVRVGELLYVTGEQLGLYIVDAGDPTDPVLVGYCDLPGAHIGLEVIGDLAFVAAGPNRLWIVDVSDPTNPEPIDQFLPSLQGHAYDVALAGTQAYVAISEGGLCVLDVSSPAAPIELGACAFIGYHRRVTAASDLALVSSFYYGLRGVDASDPEDPALAWFYCSTGMARGAYRSGHYAFVPGGYFSDEKSREGVAGLVTIDLADLAHPAPVDFHELYGPLVAIDGAGEIAYTLDWYGGFTTLDVSNPPSPISLGSCSLPAYTDDISASGPVGYVAGELGLHVLDLSDHMNPHEIGYIDLPEGARCVDVQGSLAYLTSHYVNLYIVDASASSTPELVGSLTTPSWSEAVAVSGDLAFVACGGAGVLVVDVTDPASPRVLSVFDTPGYASDVAVGLPYVYIADREEGVTVCDVRDPEHPVAAGWYRAPLWARKVDLYGDLVLIGGDFSGFFILRHEGAAEAEEAAGDRFPPAGILEPSVPDPFHGQTAIAFDLAAAMRVTLSLHGPSGRLLRTLIGDRHHGAGRHTVTWNGRDERGRPLPAGTYFLRLETAGGVETQRVHLVK